MDKNDFKSDKYPKVTYWKTGWVCFRRLSHVFTVTTWVQEGETGWVCFRRLRYVFTVTTWVQQGGCNIKYLYLIDQFKSGIAVLWNPNAVFNNSSNQKRTLWFWKTGLWVFPIPLPPSSPPPTPTPPPPDIFLLQNV